MSKASKWDKAVPLYKKLIKSDTSNVELINNFNEAIKNSCKYEDGCEIYKYLTEVEP